MDGAEIKCCCGRLDCAYLQHNRAALENLEKDVDTAARLGQALLGRHESYMVEAEADRARMVAEIETLEKQKQEVQAENAKMIQENKDLLDQLEGLNSIISESDTHLKILSTSLETAQLEVRRLTVAASRAALLEAQLSEMERNQARLEETLATTEENERSAIHRWRKAEITLRDLHDQLEKIEKESREERDKHAELMDRMEKRRAVERELDAAAGRLKGAAAATSSLGRGKNGSNVVSHFVRDILQDNATLQLSIAELKELLLASDEEVRSLRERLLLHQPLNDEDTGDPQGTDASVPLSEELQCAQLTPQEFHVHHHYHTPITVAGQRKDRGQPPIHRRQRRRKAAFPPTLFESPPKESTEAPIHRSTDSTSSISTTYLPTSPSSARTDRWLDQTPGPAFSSAPSSPRSSYRAQSIFDHSEIGFDSSRPTSPESGFSSPLRKPLHRKGPSDTSIRSVLADPWSDSMLSAPTAYHQLSSKIGLLNRTDHSSGAAGENGERPMNPLPGLSVLARESGRDPAPPDDQVVTPLHAPQIHRSSSHDSLISISGMDIHSTSSRSTYTPRIPHRIASAGTIFSSTTPVISKTNVTISTVKLSGNQSSLSLLSSVACAATPKNSNSTIISDSTSEPDLPEGAQSTSIKQRMGSWMLRKWASGTSKPVSTDPAELMESTSVPAQEISKVVPVPLFRQPGVNQKGPIFGLRPPAPAPICIHAENVDEDLLRDSLIERS